MLDERSLKNVLNCSMKFILDMLFQPF